MTGSSPRPSRRLSGLLADLARAQPTGTLRIDEYMAAALYDPDRGYYAQAQTIGGPRRDFSTIVSLSPLLGQAVARWALALSENSRGPVDIIEVGAGGGHLATAILKSAGWWARRRIRYRIVEISPQLRRAQQEHLTGRRVTWHATVAEAVAHTGCPVVVSNELVDAFPCRLFRYEGDTWSELRLPWPPPVEAELSSHPVEDLDLARFSALDPENWPDGKIPTGQVVEIHASYRDWLSQWVHRSPRLNLLTIDYGDVMPGLYRGRTAGSFRGYLAHQRLTGPKVWRAPGTIDLTCDVNFTDLDSWGTEGGLSTREFTDQAGFLKRWLPEKRTTNPRPELKAIMDPDGAGGAFKVLWQAGKSAG